MPYSASQWGWSQAANARFHCQTALAWQLVGLPNARRWRRHILGDLLAEIYATDKRTESGSAA